MGNIVLVTKKIHAYRTIGEVAKVIGVPAHVLRFWETKFSQIRPMKKGGGRRYFRPEDIALLSGIKVYLYQKEFSIKDLQKHLRADGVNKVIAAGVRQTPPKQNSTPKPIEAAEPRDIKPATILAPKPSASSPVTDSGSSTRDTLRDALAKLQGARDKLSGTLKKS